MLRFKFIGWFGFKGGIDEGNTAQHYFVTKDKLSLFYDVSVLGGELRNTVNINILP